MRAIPSRKTAAPARVSAGDCGCGSTATGSRSREGTRFSFGVLERPRYYARQLMTPDDLLLEADYFRDRLRRHNMFLHGWGVVCGALVCVVPRRAKRIGPSPKIERQESSLRANGEAHPYQLANGNGEGGNEPWLVRVMPGYILGPYGDEIVIDQPIDVPLRGGGVSGCGADSGDDLADPWCSEVFVDRRTEPFYIAIRYQECPVRPVRAQPAGCGCDDEPCEYSRFRDGFQIGFLDCCPDSHKPDQARKPGLVNLDCPECPDSPWVVLAEVSVDANGRVTTIDNCSCRRVLVSLRDYWTVCKGTDCDQPAAGESDLDDRYASLERTLEGDLMATETEEAPKRSDDSDGPSADEAATSKPASAPSSGGRSTRPKRE